MAKVSQKFGSVLNVDDIKLKNVINIIFNTLHKSYI